MVRTEFATAMREPSPPQGSMEDLVQEMVLHAGVPADASSLLLCMIYAADAQDVDAFKALSEKQVDAIASACSLPDGTVLKMRMLLGTVLDPFKFGGVVPESGEVKPEKTTSGDDVTKVYKKGGATSNAGESLKVRRAPIKGYFPPSAFDCHRKGSADRNKSSLRLLIPKEVSCPSSSHLVLIHGPHMWTDLSQAHPPLHPHSFKR